MQTQQTLGLGLRGFHVSLVALGRPFKGGPVFTPLLALLEGTFVRASLSPRVPGPPTIQTPKFLNG